jgi:hypothetical protein
MTCSTPLCENYCEGATNHCATHNALARKEHRNSLKEKKKYVIPKVTAKRKEENKAYTPLRKKYLEDHPDCEIKLIGCTGKATQIHHCSTSHKDFLNIKTWKSSCKECHRFLETVLSAQARRNLGLLI